MPIIYFCYGEVAQITMLSKQYMLYHPVLRDSLIAYFIFSKIVEMGLLSDVDGRKKLVDVLASHCARLW